MAVSDGSRLEGLRAKRDEYAEWLPRAAEELRTIPPGDDRHQTLAKVRDAHGKVVQQIAELEQRQRQENANKAKGWQAGFLAWMEVNAMRDDLLLNPPPGAIDGLHKWAIELLANSVEDWSKGEVKASACKSVIPGDAGLLLWFGNTLSGYWDFLRRKLSEDDAAGVLVADLRGWYRFVAKREWEGWQPPALPTADEAGGPMPEFPRAELPDPFPVSTFKPIGVASSNIGSRGWNRINDALASYATSGCGGLTSHICLDVFPGVERKSLDWVEERLNRDGASSFFRFLSSWVQLAGGDITVSLDDLIRGHGLGPRDADDRQRIRRQLWEWLCAFHYVCLRGNVAGKYKGRSGAPINAQEYHSLLRVCSIVYAEGDTAEDRLPIRVTIEPAKWMRDYLGVNPETGNPILPSFGDMKRVTAIPAGRPPGRWARMLLEGLSHLWRERSARPGSAFPEGEFTFSREDIIRAAGLEGEVRDMLSGDKPGRVPEYWRQAVSILTDRGEFSRYDDGAGVNHRCKGWRREWLGGLITAAPNRERLQEYGLARRSAAGKRKEDASRREGHK